MITFQANLYRPDAPGTWTYVEFPFSVEEKFGVKGRVPVKGEARHFFEQMSYSSQ